jgi:hypothetical protein
MSQTNSGKQGMQQVLNININSQPPVKRAPRARPKVQAVAPPRAASSSENKSISIMLTDAANQFTSTRKRLESTGYRVPESITMIPPDLAAADDPSELMHLIGFLKNSVTQMNGIQQRGVALKRVGDFGSVAAPIPNAGLAAAGVTTPVAPPAGVVAPAGVAPTTLPAAATTSPNLVDAMLLRVAQFKMEVDKFSGNPSPTLLTQGVGLQGEVVLLAESPSLDSVQRGRLDTASAEIVVLLADIRRALQATEAQSTKVEQEMIILGGIQAEIKKAKDDSDPYKVRPALEDIKGQILTFSATLAPGSESQQEADDIVKALDVYVTNLPPLALQDGNTLDATRRLANANSRHQALVAFLPNVPVGLEDDGVVLLMEQEYVALKLNLETYLKDYVDGVIANTFPFNIFEMARDPGVVFATYSVFGGSSGLNQRQRNIVMANTLEMAIYKNTPGVFRLTNRGTTAVGPTGTNMIKLSVWGFPFVEDGAPPEGGGALEACPLGFGSSRRADVCALISGLTGPPPTYKNGDVAAVYLQTLAKWAADNRSKLPLQQQQDLIRELSRGDVDGDLYTPPAADPGAVVPEAPPIPEATPDPEEDQWTEGSGDFWNGQKPGMPAPEAVPGVQPSRPALIQPDQPPAFNNPIQFQGGSGVPWYADLFP